MLQDPLHCPEMKWHNAGIHTNIQSRGDLSILLSATLILQKSLKWGCAEVRVGCISQANNEKTRGNGLEMHQERLNLDIRKKKSPLKGWLSIGTGSPWNWWSHYPWKCSKKKRSRCGTLRYLGGVVGFSWRLDFMILEVFPNLNDLMIHGPRHVLNIAAGCHKLRYIQGAL